MDFWCRIQSQEGKFSEYAPNTWNLAATAFATKFMGASLVLLKNGPPIDKKILAKVIEADRKAIMVTLTDTGLYRHAKDYSNQFTNVFGGALAYLSLYPDAVMRNHLLARIKQSAEDLQSPAGFFYERGGTDFGYNFNTHHSNLWMTYHYARGTALAKDIIDEEKRYYEWISYNAVPEPSGYFTINRPIEMRQRTAIVGSYFTESPLGEMVPGVRAFETGKEEKQKQINEERKILEQNWPDVPALKPGEFSTFSPYAFLHRSHYTWYPTATQKKSAIDNLPYIKRKNFIHQKMDSRNPTVFTYVRQPGYYAAFNSGPRLHEQQRYGLGLLWNPKAGSFLQSQTGSDEAAWGTINESGKLYEADTLDAIFSIGNKRIIPKPGSHDLGTGYLSISYPLGNSGKKILVFKENSIIVQVIHNGSFTEIIPLLLNKDDKISVDGKYISKSNGTTIRIEYDGIPELKETSIMSGTQNVRVLMLKATDQLNYSIKIE
jgi:hypothetical protein